MLKSNCYTCFLAVLAVSGGGASDNAVIIGEPLPLGHAFGGLGFGWNNALIALPRSNGWGAQYPSHSYSYYSGSGWSSPSTPIYKEIPITYDAGWGRDVAVPIAYNPGWGREVSVPISYNPGWQKAVPLIQTATAGWGREIPVPIQRTQHTVWQKAVPVLKAHHGWGREVPVPITYNPGWQKAVPIAKTHVSYGWSTAHNLPTYGNGWGWDQYGYPSLSKALVVGNGWGQGQGIPLLKNVVGVNGWAAPRYAGGWGAPAQTLPVSFYK